MDVHPGSNVILRHQERLDLTTQALPTTCQTSTEMFLEFGDISHWAQGPMDSTGSGFTYASDSVCSARSAACS